MTYRVLNQADQYDLWYLLSALTDHEITDRNAAPVLDLLGSFRVHALAFSAGVTPAFLVIEAEGQLIIIIAGASNANMFLAMFQGAVVPGVGLGRAHVNGALLLPVSRIAAYLSPQLLLDVVDVCIVGHSYGGSCAEILATYLAQQGTKMTIQVLTGGAPRAGDIGMSAVLSPLPVVRLMTPGDPLVRFPPHYEEAPVAVSILPYLALYNFSFWVQPGGGYLIDSTGAETPAVLPPISAPIADINLETWLIGANAAGSQQHSYRTYLSYLRAGVAAEIGAPLVPAQAGLKGETVFIPGQDVVALGPVMGPPAFQKARKEMSSVYIPIPYRFTVVRIGTAYNVVWMGRGVTQGQTKSNARTMAKYGNKMLRVLQNQLNANAANWRDSFAEYLTAASSPTTEFQPVLTVM